MGVGVSAEEDRLRALLPKTWTFEGRPLRHFAVEEVEWTFLNLALNDSPGRWKSGPDLVFHDGADTLVVVEVKVAKAASQGAASKRSLCRQAFSYGLQAKRLLSDPDQNVGWRSSTGLQRPFRALCQEAGFTHARTVLALLTLVPEDRARHRPKRLAEYLEKRLGTVAFDEMLKNPSENDPTWQTSTLRRSSGSSADFIWTVHEDDEVGTATAVHLEPLRCASMFKVSGREGTISLRTASQGGAMDLSVPGEFKVHNPTWIILHHPPDEDKVVRVKTLMETMGPPRIHVVPWSNDSEPEYKIYVALEGSHRLTASSELGMSVSTSTDGVPSALIDGFPVSASLPV